MADAAFDLDMDQWADRVAQHGNLFVTAGLIDIMNEIIQLGRTAGDVKGIFDTGCWMSSWYAEEGLDGQPPSVTDGKKAFRDSASEISLILLTKHKLGSNFTFVNGTSYAVHLEFKPNSIHGHKVRDVVARSPQIVAQTAARFA